MGTLALCLSFSGCQATRAVLSARTSSASITRVTVAKLAAARSVSPMHSDATSTDTPHWRCIRQKESGDNYAEAAGPEPYGGAYQFSVATWRALGFTGLPFEAPKATQDRAALELYAWAARYEHDPWQPWETAALCGV